MVCSRWGSEVVLSWRQEIQVHWGPLDWTQVGSESRMLIIIA